MGVTISTTSSESAFAFASGVIGLISFTFTVGTFLRVVWVNLETVAEAPMQVQGALSNLRTELLEEKAFLKTMRKQCKKWHREADKDQSGWLLQVGLDEASLKAMSDAIKALIARFRRVEQPFLVSGSDGMGYTSRVNGDGDRRRRRKGSSSPYYEHAAYAPEPKPAQGRPRSSYDGRRGRSRREDDDEGAFAPQPVKYRSYGLLQRIQWISRKGEATSLFEELSRIQIRRMARQVGAISVMIDEHKGVASQIEDSVTRMDEKMNNIIGVRRIDN